MYKILTIILFVFGCQQILAQDKLTHEVYFETDDYDVLATEENRLLQFISSLGDVDIEKVSIYGFCDDRGSDNYNLRLSQKRANAIKTIFSNNELDESLISNVDGKGEIFLRIIKDSEIDRTRGLNRKVEIIVYKKDPQTETVIETVSAPNEKTAEDIISGNVEKGDKIRLEKLYFKTGYSYLTKKSKPTLQKITKILVENENIYFSIQGHVCCTQNSRDAIDRRTNKRNLSLARAKYVYDYMLRKGIDKKRMKFVGFRRKFPLGGEAKFDRRVEILITYVAEKRKSREK